MTWRVGLLVSLLCLEARAQEIPLTSFETPEEVRAAGCRYWLGQRGATEGRQALQLEFSTQAWPHVRLPATRGDWSGTLGLALDITNPGPEPVELMVRVDDDGHGTGLEHSRLFQATAAPGRTQTMVAPVGQDPLESGMQALPPVGGAVTMSVVLRGAEFDPHRVAGYQIQLRQPLHPVQLAVDNARLLPPMDLTGIVDRFGQFSRADWPGKVHSLEELADRAAEEKATSTRWADRDRFGGWSKGPRFPSTGFFTARQHQGRWWLQDPDGYLFFSLGVNYVKIDSPTVVSDREPLFQWLPPEQDGLSQCFRFVRSWRGPVKRALAFDFYQANLLRKLGADFARRWRELALARLPSWGFNTLGNWSAHELYQNGRVPYVITVRYPDLHRHIPGGLDFWGSLPDPYDPRFQTDLDKGLQELKGFYADPFLLGYFIDNEQSWGQPGGDQEHYAAALGALGLRALDSPAKRALIEQLRQRYRSLDELNAAWGTRLARWQELEEPVKLVLPLTEAARGDLSAFLLALARQYFSVVAATVHRHDPHHLYLGCRLGWFVPEVFQAAQEHCDVVSFNLYESSLKGSPWVQGSTGQKPLLIGEFHIGATDRGMFHGGLLEAADQASRAERFGSFVDSVLDHPHLVGCHWFEYVDQPLVGRSWDGENACIGLVDVTDTPYPELIKACRRAGARLYRRR